MRYVRHFFGASVALIALAGCQSQSPVVLRDAEPDHPHRFADVRNAGPYHVRPVIQRHQGRLGIEVLDRHERPAYVTGIEQVRGELIHADGRHEPIRLRAELWWPVWQGPQEYPRTSRFLRRADWVRDAHDTRMRVRVPLDGQMHELTFALREPSPIAAHSGL